MPSFQTQLRELVAQGQLDAALALAKQAALDGLTELDTPVTLLSAEWTYLQQTVQRGMLSFEQENTNRQGLAFRLLSLVEALPEPAPTTPVAPAKTVVLFLGANPFQNLALELEREISEISAGLTHFGQRQAFDFRAKMHVTPTDLQRMLLEANDFQPRFVHFAGNAVVDHADYGTGVVFEDEEGKPRVVHGDMLARIFQQFPSVECVFLNTCDSGPSALAIGQHVKYAVGMNARIYDQSAIVFAVAFYEALAGGQDVPFAFAFARNRLLLEAFPEQASIPILIADGQCADPVYVAGESHLVEDSRPRIAR